MDSAMTLAKAREIAHAVAIGVKKFGAQFSPAYRPHEIMKALVILNTQADLDVTEYERAAKEQVTAANRRAGAAEARLQRCMKKELPLQGGEQGGDLG